jgi:hypothetical protein
MRLFNRKSELERLLENVTDALGPQQRGIKARLPVIGSGGGLKDAVPRDKAAKAGLVAGGLAALTAASAGISALRRRQEGARDDS